MEFEYHMLPESGFFITKIFLKGTCVSSECPYQHSLRLENGEFPSPTLQDEPSAEHKGEFIDISKQPFDKSD